MELPFRVGIAGLLGAGASFAVVASLLLKDFSRPLLIYAISVGPVVLLLWVGLLAFKVYQSYTRDGEKRESLSPWCFLAWGAVSGQFASLLIGAAFHDPDDSGAPTLFQEWLHAWDDVAVFGLAGIVGSGVAWVFLKKTVRWTPEK